MTIKPSLDDLNIKNLKSVKIDPSLETFCVVHPESDLETIALRVNPTLPDNYHTIVPGIPTIDGQTWSSKDGDQTFSNYSYNPTEALPITQLPDKFVDLYNQLVDDPATCQSYAEALAGNGQSNVSLYLEGGAIAIEGALLEISTFIRSTLTKFHKIQESAFRDFHKGGVQAIKGSTRLTKSDQADLGRLFSDAMTAGYDSHRLWAASSLYQLAHDAENDQKQQKKWKQKQKDYQKKHRHLFPEITNGTDTDPGPSKSSNDQQGRGVMKMVRQLEDKVKDFWGPEQPVPQKIDQWKWLVNQERSSIGYNLDEHQELPKMDEPGTESSPISSVASDAPDRSLDQYARASRAGTDGLPGYRRPKQFSATMNTTANLGRVIEDEEIRQDLSENVIFR
ncbi:hypothetical protein I302_100087 [Kwoniella bestiolae CBS 10118]|uniref:Uncharacterized protein n=1 Tax=Kwoniella bestiolae CBS 10118 TaxID=1296100 RepID=A0A1B9G439_9TREE|nr:hypothetical protein I302_03459 [Kwoniella bestiolae CBS 10118]OCF25786.1 hypothetical protein I302_03459 [Kwoniella bestiolae CBS 10118]